MTERQHNFEVGDEVYVILNNDLATAKLATVRLVHKTTKNFKTTVTDLYYRQKSGEKVYSRHFVAGSGRRAVHATPELTAEVDAARTARTQHRALAALANALDQLSTNAVLARTDASHDGALEAAAKVYAEVPDTLWAITGHVPDKLKQENE